MDANSGHRVKVLLNCVPNCVKCRAMDNAVTAGFQVWLDDMNIDFTHCVRSREALENWRTYGQSLGLTRATPQIYLWRGQDEMKGVTVVVGKVVNGYRIPPTERWDANVLKSLIRALMAKEEQNEG